MCLTSPPPEPLACTDTEASSKFHEDAAYAAAARKQTNVHNGADLTDLIVTRRLCDRTARSRDATRSVQRAAIQPMFNITR